MKLPFCGALPASFIRLLLILASIAILPNPAGAESVGIPSQKLRSIYTAQLQSEWCWAACLQMIAAFYDVDLPQSEIVRRAYGSYANRQGNDALISAYLTGPTMTRSGKVCQLHSKQYHNPETVHVLVNELSAGRPVLIGFDTGQGGHMVLCTALEYDGSKDHPSITSFTVRDPSPDPEISSSQGHQVWGGEELGPCIVTIWTVQVKPSTRTASLTAPSSYSTPSQAAMLEQARQDVKIQRVVLTTAQQQLEYCLNRNGSRAHIAAAQHNLQHAQMGLRNAQDALRRLGSS